MADRASTATHAKITRPLPAPGTLLRPRLFAALEPATARVVWISGPPGAGKTTLISSYIAQARLPCLWYQVDAGDADPATFFHYMGLAAKRAAPRVRRALPYLTPDNLPSLPLFTRRYFEELFSRLQRPAVLVLENYQEVGSDASLHLILAQALDVLPPGVRVIVISRSEPPQALARLRATQALTLLEWETLRLSMDEMRAIARLRQAQLPPELFAQLCAETQGWAAGLILALERAHTWRGGDELAAPQAVFDYFAEEIFAGMDPEAQRILLHCAFLPAPTAAQAAALADTPRAGRLLAELNQRGYFTQKHAEAGYQLHPLFRAFLRARAERGYDAPTLAAIRRRAALLLEEDGAAAEAMDLLAEAKAWDALVESVARHAPALLQQGRARTAERALRALPSEVLQREPHALLWLGICRLPADPVEARRHLEAAHALFETRGDEVSAALAWAAIIDSFWFDRGDFAPLDHWIAVMDARLARQATTLPPAIEARVACGMFAALVLREPRRADLAWWAERVMSIFLQNEDPLLTMALGTNLVMYSVWVRDFARAAVVVDALRALSRHPGTSPIVQLQWCFIFALYSWHTADHAACLAAVAEGERLAEVSGVHLFDATLFAQGVYSSVSQGDLPTAHAMLKKMAAAASPFLMDKALYQSQAAAVAWLEGDLARARAHGENALELAQRCGMAGAVALSRIELAATLHALGESGLARAELTRAMETGRGMHYTEFITQLYLACLELESGSRAQGLEALRSALAIGAREGYRNMPRWDPAMMARQCAAALEHGIEPGYARRLVRSRGLLPQGESAVSEFWPWAVRIQSLQQFAVHVDEQPLDLSTRDRRRPSDLLKTIVALGGRQVSLSQLTDALWPEADGHAAYQALHTNLHRLRKLLGKDVIRTEAGGISLDERYVWLDVWAVDTLAARIESTLAAVESPAAVTTLVRDMASLMKLYQGPLLPESTASAAFAARGRLLARVARLAGELGARIERHGDWAQAIKLYEWALDRLDPADEGFYMGIMRAEHGLGRPAAVARVYQRCRATLSALLDTAPSPAVDALYHALKV